MTLLHWVSETTLPPCLEIRHRFYLQSIVCLPSSGLSASQNPSSPCHKRDQAGLRLTCRSTLLATHQEHLLSQTRLHYTPLDGEGSSACQQTLPCPHLPHTSESRERKFNDSGCNIVTAVSLAAFL